VFSVAKSELSILYDIDEFVNLDGSKDKETIINGIIKKGKSELVEAVKVNIPFLTP